MPWVLVEASPDKCHQEVGLVCGKDRYSDSDDAHLREDAYYPAGTTVGEVGPVAGKPFRAPAQGKHREQDV